MARWGRRSAGWLLRAMADLAGRLGAGLTVRRGWRAAAAARPVRTAFRRRSRPLPGSLRSAFRRPSRPVLRLNQPQAFRPRVRPAARPAVFSSGGAGKPFRPGRKRTAGRTTPPPRRGDGRKLGRGRLLLIVMLTILSLTLLGFIFVERNLRPPLMHVATMRVKQIVTRAINESIANQVARHADAERLVDWKTSADGRVSGFMLNYAEHMRITASAIDTVQRTLHEIKHVPERIPVGQAIGSAVIASYGPRIPVRFEPVGAAKVELGTRQRDAGINMILVEVYIRITAEMAIIIPFDTKPETVVTEIPISYLLVVGDVPMYYYDNKGNPSGSSAAQAPNIALPPPDAGSRDGAAPRLPEHGGSETQADPPAALPAAEGKP